ncbi:MAG: 16S rRNA (cytidine(1402)-2'-O)-methyltransferase [Chlamydiae bacterium]|nr:MAG: 16S rRNA (cytidine(1402)-2'-O)-methyltransferase [Chlamydiota bacterium]
MLYFVATPIGNLYDLSPRAIEVLNEVDAIAAEDTRRTRKLLTHFYIKTKLFSFHQHNERAGTEKIITKLQEGKSIAVVSDSGMPLISDAGQLLAEKLWKEKIEYTCIPGASAVEVALVMSGMPTDKFRFLGFAPRDKKEYAEFLKSALSESITTIIFESPKRLLKTLENISTIDSLRQIAVARELTKIHEKVVRGTALEIINCFSDGEVKGECVIVIAPAPKLEDKKAEYNLAEMVEKVRKISGLQHSKAAKIVAVLTGISKREIYNKTTLKS